MIRFPNYFYVLFFFSASLIAQNKPFLYGFSEIPQALLVNPGSEVSFDKHIGIPFLSGVYATAGTSNKLISNLFSNNGVAINTKLRNIINRLSANDFISANEQLDIINIGVRLKNNKDYVSAGFYQEFDFISFHPKDIAVLFYQGNTDGNGTIDLSNKYNLNDIRFKGEVLGVFHIGISRRLNQKLTIGARAKLYSGIYNIQSVNNKGTISTRLDQNNEYQHVLNDIDVTLKSSGLSALSNGSIVGNAVKNVFIGGNLGVGLDAGFTYHLKENIIVTSSVLDLGFISYSNNVVTYKVKGDFEVNGLGLLDPPANETLNYWENLSDDFNTQIPKDTINKTYVSFRSPKMNGSLQYAFGKQTNRHRGAACPVFDDGSPITRYQNEVGVQFYSIFRPKKPQVAASLYYSRRIANFLNAKVTYTADSYSLSNIGLGATIQVGTFNMYASIDNLLSLKDIYNSKKVAVLFGMNLIFDR